MQRRLLLTAFNFSNLTTFQNWSEEKLKSTLRQICGLNTRLKMTHYIIVVRERDESLTQTLEECTPGGKAYTLYVAWSRMSAKGNIFFVFVIWFRKFPISI